jgi:hypothetical protein
MSQRTKISTLTLYVVEAQFKDGYWEICNFAGTHHYVDIDRDLANVRMDNIYHYLHEQTERWTRKRLRVRKYRAC